MAAGALDINADSDCSSTRDPDMALSHNLGLDVTLAERVAAQATKICMALVAARPSNTNMASGVGPHYRTLRQQEPRTSILSQAVAGPRTQTWLPVAVWAWMSSWSGGCAGLLDCHDRCGGTSLGHQHNHRWWPSPWESTGFLVVPGAVEINTEYQGCVKAMDPGTAFSTSPGLGVTIALGG